MKAWLLLFLTVFAAELGDKTQMALLAAAAATPSRMTVFTAGALALLLSSGLAVLGGGFVSAHAEPRILRRTAAFLFILLGLYQLLKS